MRARLSMSYTDFDDERSHSKFIQICIQWYDTSLLFSLYVVNLGTIACICCSAL